VVAAAGEGTFVVLFASTSSLGDTIGTDRDTFITRTTDAGESWSEAVPFFGAAAEVDGVSDDQLALAGTPAGRMIAIVHADSSPEALIRRISNDGGETWMKPDVIGDDYAGDSEPSLATDGAGHWGFVKHTHEGFGGEGDIVSFWSEDDGVTWAGPSLVDLDGLSDEADDQHPMLAADGRGTWIAVWKADWSSINDTVRYARASCP
jgi:hypothetical protein